MPRCYECSDGSWECPPPGQPACTSPANPDFKGVVSLPIGIGRLAVSFEVYTVMKGREPSVIIIPLNDLCPCPSERGSGGSYTVPDNTVSPPDQGGVRPRRAPGHEAKRKTARKRSR